MVAKKILVLVADNCKALLFGGENLRKGGDLVFIKEYQHPECHLRDKDLVSDKPGRYRPVGGGVRSFAPDHDPRDVETEVFAERLVKELHHGCNIKDDEQLIIVAAHFLYDLIMKHWPCKHSSNITHIAKDYIKEDLKTMSAHIREHLYK